MPRKPRIDPKVHLEMKLRAQQNSVEVHRQMSPMHKSETPPENAANSNLPNRSLIAGTPVFSDAGESHLRKRSKMIIPKHTEQELNQL